MHASVPDGFALSVGGPDPTLAAQLERGPTALNMAATAVSEELGFSVKVTDTLGELVGGLTGWVWGVTSGISLVWVREANQRVGWGTRLLSGQNARFDVTSASESSFRRSHFKLPAFTETTATERSRGFLDSSPTGSKTSGS
jgi:hypothetical protein